MNLFTFKARNVRKLIVDNVAGTGPENEFVLIVIVIIFVNDPNDVGTVP